jgi:hypothetical protein
MTLSAPGNLEWQCNTEIKSKKAEKMDNYRGVVKGNGRREK